MLFANLLAVWERKRMRTLTLEKERVAQASSLDLIGDSSTEIILKRAMTLQGINQEKHRKKLEEFNVQAERAQQEAIRRDKEDHVNYFLCRLAEHYKIKNDQAKELLINLSRNQINDIHDQLMPTGSIKTMARWILLASHPVYWFISYHYLALTKTGLEFFMPLNFMYFLCSLLFYLVVLDDSMWGPKLKSIKGWHKLQSGDNFPHDVLQNLLSRNGVETKD